MYGQSNVTVTRRRLTKKIAVLKAVARVSQLEMNEEIVNTGEAVVEQAITRSKTARVIYGRVIVIVNRSVTQVLMAQITLPG